MEATVQQNLPAATQNQQPEPPATQVPSEKTPQEFYAEIIRRADVRSILEELATG